MLRNPCFVERADRSFVVSTGPELCGRGTYRFLTIDASTRRPRVANCMASRSVLCERICERNGVKRARRKESGKHAIDSSCGLNCTYTTRRVFRNPHRLSHNPEVETGDKTWSVAVHSRRMTRTRPESAGRRDIAVRPDCRDRRGPCPLPDVWSTATMTSLALVATAQRQ
jgi:hypothetical protein